MEFATFVEARTILLWSAFAIAFVMGAVVNKTNFCTMGAVSDMVNIGDSGRMRSWLFAMAIAILGVAILSYAGLVKVKEAFPPYTGSQLIWAENILGGFLFGIGMTLASGCGNKTLIRIGGGNIKSIFVLAIIAVISYFMMYPFPGTDQTLMSVLFLDWIRPLAISLKSGQDLGSVAAGAEGAMMANVGIGAVLGLVLLIFVFKSADFRKLDNILGGFVVGAAVLAGWYVSSNLAIDLDGEIYTLSKYMQEWEFLADSADVRPAEARQLSPQSYTFINPMGQTYNYVTNGFDKTILTFGIMALFGVIAGSFFWSLVSRSFRIEWFASLRDFVYHFIGAILMGFGGILALGCTIGQAVTGVSTLAIGSFLAFGSIVFGSALTMKIQYYKMVYEDEATFAKSLITSLVDMKLLPSGMRKLEAV
ncbi:YeeE/YedE family protein [Kaarinaea lacus]